MSTSEIWCNIDAEKWRSYSSLSPTLHKIKKRKNKPKQRIKKEPSQVSFRAKSMSDPNLAEKRKLAE